VSNEKTGGGRIDLEAVSRLVADLERDLGRVKSGSENVQALRDEVERLRRILDQDAPDTGTASREAPRHEHVHHGLGNIRSLFENARDELATDAIGAAAYAAQIGRILGM